MVGVSAVFIAIGIVLAFAVHATIAGIDFFVIGWLLIGTGVLGLTLKMVNLSHRGGYTLSESPNDLTGASHLASPPAISSVVIQQSPDSLG